MTGTVNSLSSSEKKRKKYAGKGCSNIKHKENIKVVEGYTEFISTKEFMARLNTNILIIAF